MIKDDRLKQYPQVIGPNVTQLLQQIDVHIADAKFRDDLKYSLMQLTDLKFALDESSIVAITDRKGKIKYVNDKFCEISKYSRVELLEQDHRIINADYHSKEFMRELWKTISSGLVWRGEIKNKAKDGNYYWVNTTIVPLLDDHGQPYQFLAIRNEVTQLKKVEEELKNLMSRVIGIQEEERKRFSRELHDGIGQSLFSLLIQLDQLISDEGNDKLEKIRQEVSFLIEDVRGLAWELRPSVLDDLGVVPAIRKYLDNFSKHYGILIHFDCNLRKRLVMEKETAIYRVIQEALANIGKYADVSEANVTITENETYVLVQIIDRGKGFSRSHKMKGVGLISMEERVRGVGGKFEIHSEEGKGTTVKINVPK